MNIKRAKEEIEHTVKAYLAKDALGEYAIPAIRQRPILLMGPPGIGKTQVMEQAARECGVALVAYTITHHTRQSAVGLPFIRQRNYGGRDVSVTEYTMSEIIASVYAKMETTGLKEGHPLHRRDQLRLRDAGPHHAAVSAVQDLRQSGRACGLGHRGGRQPAGVQ